jgi:hypothetical protein
MVMDTQPASIVDLIDGWYRRRWRIHTGKK